MPRSTFQPRDRELLNARNYCHVSVPADDGTIQSVVVWCDLEDDHVVLNSAEGRSWPANLRRTGRATLTVMNLDNPEEFVTIVARLVEDTHDGANDVINALAHKYDGRDFEFDPRQQRVTFRLAPERVTRYTPH
jgi:PPOX class probable F420-dependent enzyme